MVNSGVSAEDFKREKSIFSGYFPKSKLSSLYHSQISKNSKNESKADLISSKKSLKGDTIIIGIEVNLVLLKCRFDLTSKKG